MIQKNQLVLAGGALVCRSHALSMKEVLKDIQPLINVKLFTICNFELTLHTKLNPSECREILENKVINSDYFTSDRFCVSA